jgi:excisionase family DNA binding protein
MEHNLATQSPGDTICAKQAADLIKCSTWVLYEWCKRGVVPHIRVGTRILRFRRSTLEAWLDEREADSLNRGPA